MLKKSLFFGFLVLLFLVSTVSAANIGYIVKTSYPMNIDEASVIGLLQADGHNVSFLDDGDVINPYSYDLIIIGEDITNIEGFFDNREHKTMFLSQTAAKNAGISQYSGSTTNTKIEISDNTNRITEGFSQGETRVYSAANTVSYIYGCMALNSQSLANKLYDYNKVIVLLREDSLLLNNGLCTKRNVKIFERNLFFGLPKAGSWNSKAQELFINSIDWLIEGEDKDSDGYYYDEDCDDSNADKYQFLPGYVDSDEDGYGTGSLLDVCSGDELPAGYSEIDSDCEDSDSGKYQFLEGYLDSDDDGYGSIGVLDVCSGEELPIGYSDIDNDCNDSDSDINPGAEEAQYDMIDSDCDGSAELISEILDVIWDEDETSGLDLNSYIWNPNNNDLEFYVLATSDDTYISLDNLHNFTESGIINFSSEQDWSGEDWVVFLIMDSAVNLETNEVRLIVNSVNDAPVLLNDIEDITWDEDTNLTGYLDLYDYFYDVDTNELTFSVIGNVFINIILDNGLVSFYPQHNWFGTEIIHFSASDGEYDVDSNEITLTVEDMNEPPEFGAVECQAEINEDEEYSCELSASDFENDTIVFSATNENNLNCDIDGNELTYKSDKDYNGEASCLIKASDEFGYNTYLLEVDVLPINDAPTIADYSPKGVIKLMENTNKSFSITPYDVDGDDLEVTWFLDDTEVGDGNSYLFNEIKGNYNLTASVTDSLSDPVTKTFNIFVGDISDFTCQEVGGYVLAEKQICLGEILPVKDITNCCSVPGSPKFSETERCTTPNDDITISIEDPDENDEFDIGESFDFKIEIQNNLDDKIDVKARAYLYDITEDDKIDSYKDSIKIDEGDTEKMSSSFEISEDLDEDNSYYLFVSVAEDDNESSCNEAYIPIRVARPEHRVIIEEAAVSPESILCGDYFDVEVRLKNIGASDEDVFLLVENKDINLKGSSEEFELERYDDKDTATKILSIKSPEGIKSGKYFLDIGAFYDDGTEKGRVSKEISIDCKNIEQETQEVKTLSLTDNNQEAQQTKKSKVSVVLLLLMLVVLIAIVILLFISFKRRSE